MQILRPSSLEEYASWYLQREARKSGDNLAMQQHPVAEMWLHHAGKMRNWFDAITTWNIVQLQDVTELANLVFLESNWTKQEGLVKHDGPNYRLLDRVASNAIQCGYMDRATAGRHRKYYDLLATGALSLSGEDRIAICSAESSEIASNPSATFYLLDGVGRCLPYMALLKQKKLGFVPIEALIATRADD